MPAVDRNSRMIMNGLEFDAHLGNWRKAPHNQWAFHHVRELIPTANIHNNPANVYDLKRKAKDLSAIKVGSDHLGEVLAESWTDGFLVLRNGSILYEWYAPHYSGVEPHILFSVSKSVTGALAGVMVEKGQLDVDERVLAYIPDAAGSAFEDCTVRHVLDMQVGLDFAEIYTGDNEQFNRYRAATGWSPALSAEVADHLRAFLTSIKHSATPHGTVFQYMSPNTDMLGLILESATGQRLADLLSAHIWRPLGAESDAYITVDPKRAPRAAGGICVRLRDLARFGQMMCNGGRFNGEQIIAASWIEDTMNQGSRKAWQKGSFSHLLPEGRYRNQWYQIGNPNGAICAMGIHGQWIYIDPVTEVVMVKLSSQPDPVDDDIDEMLLRFYDEVANALN